MFITPTQFKDFEIRANDLTKIIDGYLNPSKKADFETRKGEEEKLLEPFHSYLIELLDEVAATSGHLNDKTEHVLRREAKKHGHKDLNLKIKQLEKFYRELHLDLARSCNYTKTPLMFKKNLKNLKLNLVLMKGSLKSICDVSQAIRDLIKQLEEENRIFEKKLEQFLNK